MHSKHRIDPRHSERTHGAGVGAGIGAFIGFVGGLVIAGAPMTRNADSAEAGPSMSAQSLAAVKHDAAVESFVAADGSQVHVRVTEDTQGIDENRDRPERFAARERPVR